MGRIIHNKGPKKEQDFRLLGNFYLSLCSTFGIEPQSLKEVSNTKLDKMCRELWENATDEDRAKYAEMVKVKPVDEVVKKVAVNV